MDPTSPDNWDLMPTADSTSAAPTTYQFISDAADTAKLQAVQPGQAGVPWWQNLLQYGATRAIDSHYNDQGAMRLQQANSMGIAGANGYTFRPGVQGGTILPTSQAGWEKLAIFGLIGFAVLKLVHH
jgi:hypothetical protein